VGEDKMKLLELFAGSRSVGVVAEKLGMEVFSSDINQFDGINYACNILDFDYSKVPFIPDIIWASPPCTTFSIASCGHHWNIDKTPKTKEAKIGILIAKKTIEIIEHYNPRYFFIENPRGLLRKMDFIKHIPRKTVTYCQYGDTRMKPTDIWTNAIFWQSRPMCKNGDTCHDPAPRGSRTGTQGLKGAYDRSKIPEQLCREILEYCLLTIPHGMVY
jgi:site-specific DNA-cytosine methylase